MSNKKKILWSYDTSVMFPNQNDNIENYLEYLRENEEDIEKIDIEEYLDEYLEDLNNSYLEDCFSEIIYYERTNKKQYIVLAKLGLWDGIHDGGKVIFGLEDSIRKCFEDYNEIYFMGRRLMVDASHHDGNNHYEIKELTERGCKFYDHNYGEMKDRTLCEKLFKDSHYSREVTMFKEIYG